MPMSVLIQTLVIPLFMLVAYKSSLNRFCPASTLPQLTRLRARPTPEVADAKVLVGVGICRISFPSALNEFLDDVVDSECMVDQ